MGHLVSDHVMRQASEHGLSRQIGSHILRFCLEVAEQDGVEIMAIESVCAVECVWKESQTLIGHTAPSNVRAQPENATECAVKIFQCFEGHRIYHLLMEPRI